MTVTEATVRRVRWRDRLVRERYLQRFSWAMQDYPRHARVVRELRREVTATAGEVGMARAVADLGHPQVLAERYLAELGRPVPRWATGSVWGALAVTALAALSAAYALGTLDAIWSMGGGSVDRTFLGTTTTYVHTDTQVSIESVLTWQLLLAYAVVFTVPALLGARVWRLWTRPSPLLHQETTLP